MNTPPELTVIICTYNRAALLRRCLEAVALQTLPPERLEVLVIDNRSSDGTGPMVQAFLPKHPHFHYFLEQKQGLSHARNRGLAEATGLYVAYLDDDALAVPHWAECLLAAFRQEPSPLSVGGRIEPWYESPPPGWFVPAFETRSWGSGPGFLSPEKARFGFAGGNMAFPRSVLQQLGGFRTDLGMVPGQLRMGEESALYLELLRQHPGRAGRLLYYEPAALVHHFTPARNWQLSYRLERSRAAGASRALMEAARPLDAHSISMLGYGLRQTLQLPLKMMASSEKPKTHLVRWGQVLAYVQGFFGQVYFPGKR